MGDAPEKLPVLVLVTVPDGNIADQISKSLVEQDLAACVQIFDINSVFKWQGELETAAEKVLIVKTNNLLFTRIESLVSKLHPYDEPAIIQIDVSNGKQSFINWIMSSTG